MSGKKPETSFFNFRLPDPVLFFAREDVPPMEADLILAFIESLPDGIKFSLKFDAVRKGYCCAITIPIVGVEGAQETSTFWGGSSYEALEQAWVVCIFYEALKDGFQVAQKVVNDAQANIMAQVKGMSRK